MTNSFNDHGDYFHDPVVWQKGAVFYIPVEPTSIGIITKVRDIHYPFMDKFARKGRKGYAQEVMVRWTTEKAKNHRGEGWQQVNGFKPVHELIDRQESKLRVLKSEIESLNRSA